jgi:hypothetical protein
VALYSSSLAVYCVCMTPLSPLDALGPAFRRTREVLAEPFRLGFFLKIALIAALTQPSFYSSTISYPLDGLQFAFMPHAGHRAGFSEVSYGSSFVATPNLAAFGVVAVLIGIVVAVALWVLFTYLYCRLRFAVFDLVVYKRGRVGQAWSAYGRQSWRFFGLLILVSLAFLIVAGIVVGPALLNFIRVIKPMALAGSSPDPFAVLGAMFPFLLAAVAVGLLWAVVDSLMQDFLLPPMAIDDAPLESALSRFFHLARTNFGSLALYVLLRFVVGIGMTWVLMLVFFAVLVIGGLAIYGLGTVIYHALWAGTVGQVVCVALALLVGLIVLILYFAAIISIYGVSAIFKQSYAAYFFGGRYSALGDRLEPPSAPIVEFSPVAPLSPSAPPNLPPLDDAPPVW